MSSAMVFPGLPKPDKKKVLGPLKEAEQTKPQKMIAEAARMYRVTVKEIMGKSRVRNIVEPRALCMYILSTYSHYTLKEIGNMFNGRDHTTVIHARQSVQDHMETEPELRETVNHLMQFSGL